MVKLKSIGITLGLSFAVLLTGCGNEEDAQDNGNADEDTANLGEELNYTITGIEPGAGTTELARNTLEEYENLEGWELQEGSTAGMLTTLGEAIDNEEPIIVTGWTPHWMFASYDLKYLEDPKETFGGAENINTIARLGLEEDMPSAYKILDRFQWEPEDMEEVMLNAQDVSFEEAAQNWLEDNQDKVDEWTEGVEKVDGKQIELVSTPWDTERSSGTVMKILLEQQGFDVTLTPVDPAIMFQAVANAEADASLAPWLPITHGSFYEKHKDNIIDLGENLTGAKIGMVVPEYMDIDSIEDLQPKE
ncbi:glycine betaine ABC transporter substrate-binding protein [Aquibacillus sp. LR5S19]|uniref:Glycine betaine ABC transporter substrate-binding protein n=1 Tax=Aquibacillus rhizosphaerae TaxID=3051431 RepID=A0ABT7L928_9BACI|nr:glycine betaine ABC transporter substrate-binding protein [Aquibacillus sp. LR5S19]MDL4842363.1 glycine betaine ABC transporter substrate-binding protein [Aquibacillus sp. LR5S19]